MSADVKYQGYGSKIYPALALTLALEVELANKKLAHHQC